MNPKQSLKETLVPDSEQTVTHASASIEHGRHHALHHKVQARIKHHVHKLRQRPDHHKKAIAFGVAFSVTAIVFMVWYFFSLPKIMAIYKTNVAENKRLNRSANVIEGFNLYTESNKGRTSNVESIQAE